ncbi:Predicted protein [Yoonia tamlensis]|uniref:DUF2271 domain-containing protein n=1 Tax=Yoonia tamlensis TaxID=390270 RepID=A0A1I6GZN6_9RHOB|nr:DUF2271 domain-containing protein [Yoonia tamlensis]SFR47652.1 Predicted protein [Yoonia tamlensis]
MHPFSKLLPVTGPITQVFRQKETMRARALALALGLSSAPFSAAAEEATFLVQLENYAGENAYFALYLIDPDDRFVRTLWVSGDEARWYPDQPRWWKYVGRAQEDLLPVTGASTAAGDRAVIRIALEPEVLDAGYQIRVDTSVEDQQNFPNDIQIPLESTAHGEKIEGTGYVRYIRYAWE